MDAGRYRVNIINERKKHMASRIYLGYPPPRVIDWINRHSKPAAGPRTKMTFADGSVEEYDWKGVVTI